MKAIGKISYLLTPSQGDFPSVVAHLARENVGSSNSENSRKRPLGRYPDVATFVVEEVSIESQCFEQAQFDSYVAAVFAFGFDSG